MLRNHVTQTVCQCNCVCVSALHGWRGAVREHAGPLFTHMHAHTLSTHPSPEEGNLSAVCDVTSCIHTESMHSQATLNVSTCRRCINSSSRRSGTSSYSACPPSPPACENTTQGMKQHLPEQSRKQTSSFLSLFSSHAFKARAGKQLSGCHGSTAAAH